MTEVLAQLLEMGFPEERAKKALSETGGSVEAAMEWLINHEEDQGTGTSEDTGAQEAQQDVTASSFKCDDCGKLLRDQDAVMFHAGKTNHENFSESTEELKPLTAEERATKAAELREKLAEVRKIKVEKEREEQVAKEKRRREEGKLMLERREQQKENELRQIAADRRREKLEDAAAKQRILDQIKADKEARKAREQGTSVPEPTKPIHSVAPTPKVDYQHANLQIRLFSGEAVRHTFEAKATIKDVYEWIKANHNQDGTPFHLMTTFPRKRLDGADDFNATLESLGLVPSAVLIMSRNLSACQ
ncbi:unnamed protein product, partial [Mesorhabditis spiculigera]